VIRLLLLWLAALALAPMASAHEIRPAFLQIREVEPNVYDFLWKTPSQGEMRLALNVLRKHRLVETFLVNVLKMDWATVHAEAEQLEHAISDDVLDRLDALLGHPETDPHGDPIPSRQGKLDSQVYATLATCVVEKPLRIVRITDQSAEFLSFAEQNGLLPGESVRVTERNLAAGLVSVKKGVARPLPLSLAAAGKILVQPTR
jgi:DtxR family Mn-dependent transcriptional regulator